MNEDAEIVARYLGLSNVDPERDESAMLAAMRKRGWRCGVAVLPHPYVFFTKGTRQHDQPFRAGHSTTARWRCARVILESEGPPPVTLTLRFVDEATRDEFVRVARLMVSAGVEVVE